MRDDRQLKYLFYGAANKPTHFRLVFAYAKKQGQRHCLYNKLFTLQLLVTITKSKIPNLLLWIRRLWMNGQI
jgi:hypothetical protein